jgi:amidohydrolase
MFRQAREIEGKLVTWRRDFHMHPELGFQETRTAAYVADTLESLGLQVRRGVGRTGVVGDLGEGSPTIGIRADMDALPIQEENDIEYASQVPGVMHACGHDAHTAIGLGVATLLSKEEFPGTVRFLFQPAEEIGDDEGISGAPRMVEDGAMEGVDMVLALHVGSDASVGDIQLESGPSSGGVDSFSATIIGKGGHGASPHKTVDPFFITSHVIQALYGIPSRRLDPFAPAVISIGSIHGGCAENVIPERVEMSGTIRFMEQKVQKEIHTEIERAFKIAPILGGDYKLKIEIGSLPIINDQRVVDLLTSVITDVLGDENILPFEKSLGAEDFGSFSELAPGAMFMLGCKIEEDVRFHHHPRFDIDERCLPIGAGILAEAALRFLRKDHLHFEK